MRRAGRASGRTGILTRIPGAMAPRQGHTEQMDTPAKRRAELGPARVLGIAALASGILAAAVNADAWWFLLGVIAAGFLFVASEE
ncbi:hypothetical protein GCM10017788_03690 [Amycolatopsis acidiphila]|nr:hypothetical protein GCM10017788_03690 [Amycolatopsis acidiphila]